MKWKSIALVQDVVCKNGGAESVLEVFLEMFPICDFYTLFIVSSKKKWIENNFPEVKIHVSVFQNLIKEDKVPKFISIIKIFSWIYWKIIDLKKYDLILSSSHSFGSKNIKKNANNFHVSYIHTPPRYLYDEFNEMIFLRKVPWCFLFWPIKNFLKKIDKDGAKNIDLLITNSINVQSRIKKYYKRNSVVIYPPVKMLVSKIKSKEKKYFICFSRLVKQKGIDLVIRTCTVYKLPLLVVGDGNEFNNLKKIAGKTVKFKRKCSNKEKSDLLIQSKALIYSSIDEDFGMIPVEAMSLGIPVIAFNSGGVKESVVDKKTGLFFTEYNEKGLKEAIDNFQKNKFDSETIKKQAINFDVEKFKKSFFDILKSV